MGPTTRHCILPPTGQMDWCRDYVQPNPNRAYRPCKRKIRGGTNGATAKLRGLLKQEGVPEELLDERIEEIKSQVGERGIKEAYSSFDPWSHLKAACSKRLVKEAESRNKPKAKVLQPDDDPLQTNDPWSMALQERSQWSPEATFFKTEAGNYTPLSHRQDHSWCNRGRPRH